MPEETWKQPSADCARVYGGHDRAEGDGGLKVRNSKLEIRNSNQIRITEFEAKIVSSFEFQFDSFAEFPNFFPTALQGSEAAPWHSGRFHHPTPA